MIKTDLEERMENLPDKIADALTNWRLATLLREKAEALAYARFKGEDANRTATEIKHLINTDSERYQAMLKEISAESQYTRLLEKLLCAKKMASLRTAF